MLVSARALTVLVVAHNDSQTLLATIERVYRALSITVEDFAVTIFDDGSTDDTNCTAEFASRKYPFVSVRRNEKRMGPGFCTIQGSAFAATPYVVYVPADNTWPLRSFVELFGHLGKADVVTSYSNNLLAAMRPSKRLVSRSYSIILNILFRRGIRYYNGLTIYPVEYLRQGPIRTYGFGFQAEALLKAVTAGYGFLEIALPIDTENLPRARSFTLANVLNASATIFRLLFEFYVLRGRTIARTTPSPQVTSAQSADEFGIAEPQDRSGAEEDTRTTLALRVVISGASSGIGKSIALALAEDGHKVFICARRADRLAEIAKKFPSIDVHVCDVSDEHQVEKFVSAVSAKIEAADVLINCAGGFGEIGAVAESDPGRWWNTIEINLKGTYLLTRYMLPLLAKGRQPRIINFAGGGAFSPYPNYSAYACSKTAIVRLTECLAAELSSMNIRVNAVAPGLVPTEMHDATLAAGEQRAGRLQFQRTHAILQHGGSSMETVMKCIRMMLSPSMDSLTGKTISSNFDPWQARAFQASLPEIVRSDLYTLRRINIVNLPEGRLRETLSQPWNSNSQTR